MFQSFSANIRVVDQEKSTHKAVLMGCPVNISTDLVALLFLLNEWEQREGFNKDKEERYHEDRASFFYSNFIHDAAKLHMYSDTNFEVEDIKIMSEEEFAALQVVQEHIEYHLFDFDVLERLYLYMNSDEFDEQIFYLDLFKALKKVNPLLAEIAVFFLDMKHEGIYYLTEECVEGLLEHISSNQPATEAQ